LNSSHGNRSSADCAGAFRIRTIAACALVAGIAMPVPAAADDARPWEIAPYRVRVTLATDDQLRPESGLESELARIVRQRTDSALRPLWALDLQIAVDAAAKRTCFDPVEMAWSDLEPEQRAFDKLLWLGVEATPTAYKLTCREFDAYTRRWGTTLHRDVAQRAYLAEACFRLLADAFTPLARIETPDDEGRTPLVMKGGGLPRPDGPDLLIASDDVFLPLLRRTSRGGELAEGGIVSLPWTYLVAAEPNGAGWTAQLSTALRNPLSGRRRGSIEQLAVALGPTSEPVRVRFFARSNREQLLVGYEVFRVTDETAPPQLVGLTGADGVIEVPPQGEPVTALILRSDGQVLAKMLVAPGTAPIIDAPIADDAVRLAAQGEMQAVREELIDVVARRAILVARVQTALKDGDVAKARELMDQLNSLPTASAFASRIQRLQDRLPASDDPGVRQTVEGLYSSTRELLAKFLDARTIINLQAEINSAPAAGS
jgi:hypothetical protein